MKLWIDAQLSPALAKWITEKFASIEAIAVRDKSSFFLRVMPMQL